MISLFYKLKRDKFLAIVSLVLAMIAIVDMSCIIFNIVQIANVTREAVSIANSFLGFNIFVIIFNFLGLVLVAIYLIRKRLKIIAKNEKK